MCKYNIGDRVRFKTWDDMVDEFGLESKGHIDVGDGLYFLESMLYLCGREYVVEDVKIVKGRSGKRHERIILKYDNIWRYSPGMFVFADEPVTHEVEIDLDKWGELL